MLKPYQRIAIADCREPLVPIPTRWFDRVDPHPYVRLGAPYGDKSPFFLRQGVIDRLFQAQQVLHRLRPGWKLQIFDAYRPVEVQQFMVDYSFQELLRDRGWDQQTLTETQQQDAMTQVYQFWAKPNFDPAAPPPHSTGAAVDLTLIDATGQPIDMGGAIDEISPRSYPDHYIGLADPEAEQCDRHRQLLHYVMKTAGFQRHYHEWWHFSWGDQLWAWLIQRQNLESQITARYGRV
jgi:zinc D-Ala-D-Ala dipeptidase